MNYAFRCTDLGLLMIASGPIGIRFLSFVPDRESGERELQREFPSESLNLNESIFFDTLEQIEAYLHGRRTQFDLPLELNGTPFQQQVWAALQRIPYGQTMTYRQLAESIDRPEAVRAVARACATNPVSLLVPCHRVIGSNGSLTGYRWGLSIKEQLLEREKQSTAVLV